MAFLDENGLAHVRELVRDDIETATTNLATQEYVDDKIHSQLDILQAVYPVGALYLSSVDADPATLFGFGTWERVKDTFLLAAGDTYAAGATGGEETHSHKYGIQYGGYYRQAVFENNENAGALIYDKAGDITIAKDSNALEAAVDVNQSTVLSTMSVDKSNFYRSVGQASYESNLPPYLAVYVWQRTA